MKVGILTFHHTTNYGAILQTYALWKTVESQGHDVEIIDYRPYRVARHYRQAINPVRIRKKKIYVQSHAGKELVKYLKMRFFLLSKMRLSKNKTYTKDKLKNYQHYDLVICGSDQVWCLDTNYRGFDPSYFLDFVYDQTTCRKISYAASFGNTENLGKNKELICNLISQFDNISVRDSNSLRLVQQECHGQAIRVLDPTFLIEYSEIVSEPNFEANYLLIYVTFLTVEEENFIKTIAESNNLVIISIGQYSRIAAKSLIGIGPGEWIGYFSKASYIITKNYHGAIFSLLFKKNFTVLPHKLKPQKINDLLTYFGLENRVLDWEKLESGIEEALNHNIDYDSVSEKINEEILISKTYLFEALDSQQEQLSNIYS